MSAGAPVPVPVRGKSPRCPYSPEELDGALSLLRLGYAHLLIQTAARSGPCPLCQHRFKRLDRHLKVHFKCYDYICPTCLKPFIQNVHYQRHVRIHTGLPTPFECHHCGKRLTRKDKLLEHILKFHQ